MMMGPGRQRKLWKEMEVMFDPIDIIKKAKARKIRLYPQHVPRASEIGHPCERYLVYCINNWQDRQPHGPEVEFIFEGGRLVEELAIKDFEDAGFKVYRPEPDKAIMESKPRITGHLDIRVDFGDNTVYTGEIKGLNVYDWEKLNTIEDFFKSKKLWIKKYPAQLMTYLYIKGEERGFFYLKSIPRFQPKLIWVDLDYIYMEEILKKAERIETHVKNNTLPEQCGDDSVCEYCPFAHICLPIHIGKEVEVDAGELSSLLDRLDELKGAKKEYGEIDEQIGKMVKGKEKILAGNWFIVGQYQTRKAFSVGDVTFWKKTIRRIQPEKQTR